MSGAKKEKDNESSGTGLLAGILVAGGAAAIGFMAHDLWNMWKETSQQEQPHSSRTSSQSEQAKMNARKKNRNTSSSEDLKCIVCFNNEREITLEPCGHVVLCIDCGEKVKRCPVCNRSIDNKKMVFLS